jgi:hypothetical protein
MATSTATRMVRANDSAAARQRMVAVAIGVAGALWLVLLSGWLKAVAGSVVSHRHNVIFSSDTNLWVAYIFGHLKPDLPQIHPLQIALWRGPARVLSVIPGLFLHSDLRQYAVSEQYIGARILVALIAGFGFALLALLALRKGLRTAECVALFLMYFLFTSTSTLCLPEHFGISNGLLTVAFVAPLLMASARARLLILGALTPLIGGTTVTNAIFPLLSFVQWGLKSARVRIAAIILGIPAALGAAYVLYHVSWNYRWFISTDMEWRIFRNPLSTAGYLVYFFIAPAIGPPPLISAQPLGPMLSYEPLPLRLYAGIPAIGAVVWAVLLCRCAWKGYQTRDTRPAVMLLLGWILFNAIFHNIWGSELILYAPHWSWAMIALVLLGARHFSRRYVMTSAALVIACQIPTLLAIHTAVQSIAK